MNDLIQDIVKEKIKTILQEGYGHHHSEDCGANYFGVKEWTCRCGTERSIKEDTETLYDLFSDSLQQVREKTAEDICKITDDIELSYRNTTMEEWKAFKHIRNAIRDKYALREALKRLKQQRDKLKKLDTNTLEETLEVVDKIEKKMLCPANIHPNNVNCECSG